MRKISFQNLSLLSFMLLATSTMLAAIMPNKPNEKRVKNGQLQANSASIGGPAGVLSCKAVIGAFECTATNSKTSATAADSCVTVGPIRYQTINNTSQNGIESVWTECL